MLEKLPAERDILLAHGPYLSELEENKLCLRSEQTVARNTRNQGRNVRQQGIEHTTETLRCAKKRQRRRPNDRPRRLGRRHPYPPPPGPRV